MKVTIWQERLQGWTPAVFKKVDKNLLLFEPESWATQSHTIVAAVLPVYLLMQVFLQFAPLDINVVRFTELIFGLSFIPTVLAVVFYAYYRMRFSVTAQYGIQGNSFLSPLKNFALTFIAVSAIGFFPYIGSQVWLNRFDNQISTTALVQDVNQLSLGEPFFETGGFEITKTPNGLIKISPSLNEEDYPMHNFDNSKYTVQRWQSSPREVSEAVTHDEGYVTLAGALDGQKLAQMIVKPMTEAQALRRIQNYLDVSARYGVRYNIDAETILNLNLDPAKYVAPGTELAADRFTIYQILEKSLEEPTLYNYRQRVVESVRTLQEIKMGTFDLQFKYIPTIFFVVCFYVSVLLFTISYTSWRNFFVGSMIFTALPGAIALTQSLILNSMGIYNTEKLIVPTLLFEFVVLGLVSIASLRLVRYRPVYEFALYAFMMSTPFIPFIMYVTLDVYKVIHASKEDIYFVVAACALVSLMSLPFGKRLYLNLRALPSR